MIKVAVIGVGNRSRGDDAVGCLATDRLRERLGDSQENTHAGFDVLESNGDVGQLLEWFQRYDHVVVVDALKSSGKASVIRWDAIQAELPGDFSTTSSHGFGVVQAVELARALGQLPKSLVIYGIAGRQFEMKEGLSPETAAALRSGLERIFDELEQPLGGITDA